MSYESQILQQPDSSNSIPFLRLSSVDPHILISVLLQSIIEIVDFSPMRLGTLEEYVGGSFLDRASALNDTLASEEIYDHFPFSVIIEADYPEWDVAERWCWQTFGPRHGECNWGSDYPACPIILAAEKILTTVVRAGQEYKYMTYSNPVEHSHSGPWTAYWFGKTSYDHGFGAFCFSNENDKNRFIAHVPEVNLGEKYI